jgi:tRNA(Ile2) C34 agmatinyltransferase TiaS
MAEVEQTRPFTVECPHCHKPFDVDTVQGKGRIRGFKCPHCRLFVPYDRVAS